MMTCRQLYQSLAILLVANPLWAFSLSVGRGYAAAAERKNRLVVRASDDDNDDGPDLFDYFDPLRSPHDYPDGIRPDTKPTDRNDPPEKQSPYPKQPLGLDLMGSGIAPDPPKQQQQPTDNTQPSTFKSKFASSDKAEKGDKELDILDVFDPTLSPHAYPNGIPSTTQSTKATTTTTIGIVLMDHGSRNDMSNQRLHDLARLYQNSFDKSSTDSPQVIVRAAHMEIASPSIPQVLEEMMQFELDEIVCHPFFLSPGRHVQEDVPRILRDAVESLGIEIPLTLTAPVGSNTETMIKAIHSIVEENSVFMNIKGRVSRQ